MLDASPTLCSSAPATHAHCPDAASGGIDTGHDDAGTNCAACGYVSDISHIARLREGDMESLGVLFQRHHSCILGVAKRLVDPTTAEDMAAEAIERLAVAVRRGRGPTATVCGYLRRIVRSCVVDYHRRRRESPQEWLHDHAVGEDGSDSVVDGLLFRQIFSRLPERWRDALWLAYTEAGGRVELARTLGLRPQAATQLLYRARAGLREELAREGVLSARD